MHERQIQQVEERGGQLFMLVTDGARRNGELLTAPVAKPARTSVRQTALNHAWYSQQPRAKNFPGDIGSCKI